MGKMTTLAGDTAVAVVGAVIVLAGFSAVSLAQGGTRATSDADMFSYFRAAGASASDLCQQAAKTSRDFKKESNQAEFDRWKKITQDRCAGVKIDGPLPF